MFGIADELAATQTEVVRDPIFGNAHFFVVGSFEKIIVPPVGTDNLYSQPHRRPHRNDGFSIPARFVGESHFIEDNYVWLIARLVADGLEQAVAGDGIR